MVGALHDAGSASLTWGDHSTSLLEQEGVLGLPMLWAETQVQLGKIRGVGTRCRDSLYTR